MKEMVTYSSRENQLFDDVRAIIEEARTNAIRSVDFNRVLMYWNISPRSRQIQKKIGLRITLKPISVR
jgi:hypothetical protein